MPKPSFGCAACRRRRVKCDERQNGCGNCQRYGTPCPGYQDKFDVLHRMRTTSRVPSLGQAYPASELIYPTSTIHPPLQDDHDDVALAMYYGSHCVDGSTTWPLDHLRSQGNGCLFAAIKVLGDMEIVRRWSLPNGSDPTMRDYIAATKLLNSSLALPTESRRDSTLLATFILGAVEIKAAHSQSLEYWEAHAKGAAALLMLRGVDQVTSRLGSALYFQVSGQMITSCILARRHVPQELHSLRTAVQTHLVKATHPVWKHQGAMFRFTDFVAATRTDTSDLGLQDAWRVIAKAFGIYTELLAIFKDASAEWQYDLRPSAQFPGLISYEHVYRTILATQLWNGYRLAMIVLCTIVARILDRFPGCTSGNPEVQTFSENSVAVLNREALEAVAAVAQPFALVGLKSAHHAPPLSPNGHNHSAEKRLSNNAPVFRESEPDSQALPYMHGCLMQWPIYFAAESEFVEPGVRRCLFEILDTSARTMQVQQWQVLADKLRPVIGESYSTTTLLEDAQAIRSDLATI